MKSCFFILALFLIIASSFSVHAQNFHMEPTLTNSKLYGLKVDKLFYKNTRFFEVSDMSGVYTLYANFQVNNGWYFLIEVPYVVAKATGENESGFGNVFVRFKKPLNKNQNYSLSFGGILPTIGEENFFRSEIAIYSNIYRTLYTIPSTVTAYMNFAMHNPRDKKEILGIEIGPDLLIPFGELNTDPEFYLHAALKGGYKLNPVWLWAEYSMIMVVSEEDLDFNDRTLNQLSVGGQFRFGKFNPGIFYSFPLDELIKTEVSGALGVKLELEMGDKKQSPTGGTKDFER